MYKNRQLLVTNRHINNYPPGTIIVIKEMGASWSEKQKAEYYSHPISSMTDEEVALCQRFRDLFYFDFNSNNVMHISGLPLTQQMAPPKDEFSEDECDCVADSLDPNWKTTGKNSCQFLHSFLHGESPSSEEEYSLNEPWIDYRKDWMKKCFYLADKPGMNRVIWAYRHGLFGSAIQAWKALPEDSRNLVRGSFIFTNRDKEILGKIWQ